MMNESSKSAHSCSRVRVHRLFCPFEIKPHLLNQHTIVCHRLNISPLFTLSHLLPTTLLIWTHLLAVFCSLVILHLHLYSILASFFVDTLLSLLPLMTPLDHPTLSTQCDQGRGRKAGRQGLLRVHLQEEPALSLERHRRPAGAGQCPAEPGRRRRGFRRCKPFRWYSRRRRRWRRR